MGVVPPKYGTRLVKVLAGMDPHSFIVASLVLFFEAAESIATLVIRSPETVIAPGNR